MGKKLVKCKINDMYVGNVDIVFEIMDNLKKIGTLRLSRGAVEWVPKWKSKKKYKATWEKFEEILKNHFDGD